MGSVALDLNYFLYSSLKEGDRKIHLEKYLNHYFNEYQTTLKKCDIQEGPFTLQELKDEQKEKVPYGAVVSMFLLPIVFANEEEAFDFSATNDDNFDELMQDWNQKNIAMMLKKPSFKAKFLSIFEDLEDYGFTSDYLV